MSTSKLSTSSLTSHHSTSCNKPSFPGRTEMYRALVDKDPTYEGIFVAAIKTTGIFCRSSCAARKPKPENVIYYANCAEALSFGFRPCKVCKPQIPLGETPTWIANLLAEITRRNDYRMSDYQLKERGMEPATLRRWFKKHHGMTFQGYLRALRLNQAIGLIKHNESVIDSAFKSGYESLSGFNEAFRNLIGDSPSKIKSKSLIVINRIITPLGPMIVGASSKGICLLEFYDRRMLETQLKRLSKLLNANFMTGEANVFFQLNQEISDYFLGKIETFTVPLDVPGTVFQQSVWRELGKIPYGETRSYQQQSIALGNPKAVRAVAKANGENRIAIIIPCHRVIGKSGKLTGYGGGIWRKQRLLELERKV